MTITMPPALALYLESQRLRDTDLLDRCFAADAVVRDEGRTMQGLARIKAWKTEAQAKYQYEISPVGVFQDGEAVKMLTRLTGNFPGGIVDLMHVFVVADGMIQSLDIRLPVELEGRQALATGGTKGGG